LAVIDEQIATAQSSNTGGSASAGQVVGEAQQARDDGATTQTPQQPVQIVETDGRISPENVETGTDDPTRTLEQTQATPPAPQQVFVAPGDEDAAQLPFAPTQGGVGSPGEDSGSPLPKNSTVTAIDNVFNENAIVPQGNVLDQYASYTYQASVYLMKPDAYTQMINTRTKTLNGAQLLFQSGGAPVNGRNPYFTNDYYIDRITLKSTITGKGTNAAHNVNNINMTVIEPNGITLIRNLDQAVQSYLGTAGNKKKNFSAQLYLLVIRFYGYDANGNLVQAGSNNSSGSGAVSPGSAFVEKYYPMAINNIKFKVSNKLVEYEIEATAPKYQIAVGQNRGTIPYNVELGGMTVKDALAGTAVISDTTTRTGGFTNEELNRRARENGVFAEGDDVTPAPPTAATAPNPKITIRKGLVEALNQYQKDLVQRGTYSVADEYSIEFVNPSIEQAKIKRAGGDIKNTATQAGGTAKDKLLPEINSVDPNSRIIAIMAGKQIVQVIDEVVRNSTYIEDQQTVKILENTQRQVPNGSPGKNVAWFKISLEATPIKYDPKRNDYAYRIKYIVHPYRINEVVSNYFQMPSFKGVHKQYNYWFTGENTQVLNYEQNYNALYSSVLSGGSSSPASLVNDQIKFNFQPRSSQSSQGADLRTNEPAANLADYLYNPSDLATATLSIVGDPGWLQQGEAFATPAKTNFGFGAFLSDGTINFESQQILFEILINTPGDYDLNTGLMDPNQRSVTFQSQRQPGSSRQSYIYRANECVSEFSKGKFTQTIKGTLMTYIQDQTMKSAADAGRPATPTIPNVGNLLSRQSTKANSIPAGDEWVEVDGVYVLKSDQTVTPPSDGTEEELELLSDSLPQTATDPEPASSNGDIADYDAGLSDDAAPAGVNSEPQIIVREA